MGKFLYFKSYEFLWFLNNVIFRLSYLEALISEIDLSNNNITSVPTFMSQFTRISYLNLSSNGISDLPKEFGLLNTLRELNIANNK